MNNFKSIREIKLDCRRVNVFIGEPNSGKSNILESIGALSGAAYGYMSVGLPGFVRMQSMIDWFYNKTSKREIAISFDGAALRVNAEQGVYQFRLETSGTKGGILAVNSAGNPTISFGGEGPFPQLRGFKFYRFRELTGFSSGPSDFLLPPYGQNLLTLLLSNEELRQIVRALCRSVGLKLILKEAEQRIELQKEFDEDVAISFQLNFTSETLQRMIFNLATIYSNKKSIITLEEPEAHAFPFHAKSLAETIGLDKRENQYFIATHNPYFLTSIVEKTPKEEISIGITSLVDNETVVKQLSTDKLAEVLEGGADAFFNLGLLSTT